jgi:cytochrome c biogenesis protein
MTQDAQTGRLVSEAVSVESEANEPDAGFGIDDVLESLWGLLTSMRFGVVIILALAALGLVGTMVIQAPPGIATDAAAKADWLDEVRPKYGGWTGILDQLQVFTIFESVWFRALAALLTASLVACSAHRLPGLWKTATKPHVAIGDAFFTHAPQHEFMAVKGTGEEIGTRVTQILRRHHYRVVSEDDGVLHMYADKFRWGPFGTVIGHLSLVVILAGALVGSAFGFRDTSFVVAEGSTVPVASGEGIAVELLQFQDAYYTETGAPADYASDLVIYQDGAEVARQTVRVNDPLRYAGLSFYQSFYGPAAAIRVNDPAGAEVFADGVPLAWTEGDSGRRVGSFTIPGADLTVWIIGTAGTGDTVVAPGQMRVEVYKASEGTPVAGQTIDQRTSAELAGYTFAFDREMQYTGLSVARDPGTPLIWLGSLLMIAGFVLVLMFPHRRVWGRLVVRGDGRGMLSLAAAGRRDVNSNTEFTDLVTEIRAAFTAPTGR